MADSGHLLKDPRSKNLCDLMGLPHVSPSAVMLSRLGKYDNPEPSHHDLWEYARDHSAGMPLASSTQIEDATTRKHREHLDRLHEIKADFPSDQPTGQSSLHQRTNHDASVLGVQKRRPGRYRDCAALRPTTYTTADRKENIHPRSCIQDEKIVMPVARHGRPPAYKILEYESMSAALRTEVERLSAENRQALTQMDPDRTLKKSNTWDAPSSLQLSHGPKQESGNLNDAHSPTQGANANHHSSSNEVSPEYYSPTLGRMVKRIGNKQVTSTRLTAETLARLDHSNRYTTPHYPPGFREYREYSNPTVMSISPKTAPPLYDGRTRARPPTYRSGPSGSSPSSSYNNRPPRFLNRTVRQPPKSKRRARGGNIFSRILKSLRSCCSGHP